MASDVPLEVRGDAARLRQILINLTNNAVKFTLQGEVVIRSGLVSQSDSHVWLRSAVSDTGIGIPADKRGRLFGKFSQVDSSTTRIYGGSGLGLVICKQLTELMGGEISVHSQAGQGSEFWFTVRLAKASGYRPATIAAQLLGLRVLIVDQTPIHREMLLVLLNSWGLRPAQAADGPDALRALTQAKAEQDPFAVALVDVHLGRAIKDDADLNGTRLVICRSIVELDSLQSWEEIGFGGSLTKPVRRQELQEVLEALVSSKTTRPWRGTSTQACLWDMASAMPKFWW